MRVGIEKRHIDSYKKIVREANSVHKSKKKKNRKNIHKILTSQGISAEKKKEGLIKTLHDLLINSFSVDIKKVRSLEGIKHHAALIRATIQKLKSINNYFEETLLRELGVIRKSALAKALNSGSPKKFIEKQRGISKSYLNKIEHTVYQLMSNIVFFDERLIKNYSKKEFKTIENEKFEIKDLEEVLRIETELLHALEAKSPPPSKIRAKLFTREIFNQWIPLVFAFLACLESEYKKEKIIFAKLKKNSSLRKIIESKIKHVIDEKEKILRIKHERASSMKGTRQVFHDYVASAEL